MAAANDAPVLVGVGSERDLPLVELAAREAAAFEHPLQLIHTFDWGAAFAAESVVGTHDEAAELLDRAVKVARAVEETLPVGHEIAEGSRVQPLIRRSETAFLVAVGDSGMSTRQLGCSLPADTPAVQLVTQAGCPVLVTRREPPIKGPVLVGVDGSVSSRQALKWAFDCAVRRSGRLVAVRVVEHGHDDAPAILADAVAEVGGPEPGVPVECHTIPGAPGDVLVEQSRSAQLVVIAARGQQPGRGMIGSACQAMLYHSPTPTVVVRGLAPADSP
ncbi:universal stress protein [Salinispora oceanensis]|uniref:universal stress protein n=1 Tax=Salinispora oceanensis TaxID=1050199 RepID=UPI0003718C2A|nr:universal stress protein [Salinispora oceanensis]